MMNEKGSFAIALDALEANIVDADAVKAIRICEASDELLAALESITNESVCLKAEIVEQARAAIAKAKGG